jgi:uncharacterized membrane protein
MTLHEVDSTVGHTVGWVKTAILKVLKTLIELGNLKVLYQTTSKSKVFFLTRIGVGVARHFRFDITTHGKVHFMCL